MLKFSIDKKFIEKFQLIWGKNCQEKNWKINKILEGFVNISNISQQMDKVVVGTSKKNSNIMAKQS